MIPSQFVSNNDFYCLLIFISVFIIMSFLGNFLWLFCSLSCNSFFSVGFYLEFFRDVSFKTVERFEDRERNCAVRLLCIIEVFWLYWRIFFLYEIIFWTANSIEVFLSVFLNLKLSLF